MEFGPVLLGNSQLAFIGSDASKGQELRAVGTDDARCPEDSHGRRVRRIRRRNPAHPADERTVLMWIKEQR
jgi:hypothetical protein